jgi:hypothetical protein
MKALIGPMAHDALLRETPERFAQRGAADLKACGKLDLNEALTWGERAVEDTPAEHLGCTLAEGRNGLDGEVAH